MDTLPAIPVEIFNITVVSSALVIVSNISTSYIIPAYQIHQYTLSTILYNRYLHPLSKYPGPFLWTISRIPFAWSLKAGHLVHDTKRFHDQYGTIVRLAPNELSFIEPQAWQDIYGHRKRGHKEFPKNPIWTPPSPNGAHSLINAAEKDHPRMRKPLVPAFSTKALREQEEIIQQYVGMLVSQLRGKCKVGDGKAEVDMKDYYNWTTFDILVYFQFSN
jgi:hypothetical protein